MHKQRAVPDSIINMVMNLQEMRSKKFVMRNGIVIHINDYRSVSNYMFHQITCVLDNRIECTDIVDPERGYRHEINITNCLMRKAVEIKYFGRRERDV